MPVVTYTREQYLAANCQFLVKTSGDYDVQARFHKNGGGGVKMQPSRNQCTNNAYNSNCIMKIGMIIPW